jgi:hypothetical protein
VVSKIVVKKMDNPAAGRDAQKPARPTAAPLGVYNLMNQGKRKLLIEKVRAIGMPDDIKQTPVVTLEDFFEGNDDLGSIGCNLLDHPGVDAFYETFLKIRARDDVFDVLIGIYEIDEDDEEMWPFSELAYIITSANENDVTSWVYSLEVDDVRKIETSKIIPVPEIGMGHNLIQLWWD